MQLFQTRLESDDLLIRLREETSREPTQEELREFRVRYIMTCLDRDDDETRREVEKFVDEHYGVTQL